MKRVSWTETFLRNQEADDTSKPVDISKLIALDDALHNLWDLGRNIVLIWSADKNGLDVVVIPHYLIVEFSEGDDDENYDSTKKHTPSFVEALISGNKKVTKTKLREIAKEFGAAPNRIELPFVPGRDLSFEIIDSLIKRYSNSLVNDRAVALFDSVGFSLYSPLEQVTQLNSLAYSVNNAHSKLLDNDIDIRFARTTTGDGFYICNRSSGISDAVDLYHFMHLVLADNAIAQSKASANTVPLLRACFHVGPHYEFYQSEGLSPTTFSYIVGDVTIELARMIDRAKPGQIVIGDFEAPIYEQEKDTISTVNTVQFIDMTQDKLSSLEGLSLAGDGIESMKCYLTGDIGANNAFNIKQYKIMDKHGLPHKFFNAKLKFYRQHAYPIFLGLQDSELFEFEVVETRTSTA